MAEWFPALAGLPADVFVVGGAVRDALLGIEPIDADLTAAGAESIARDFAVRHRTRVVELGREPLAVWRVIAGERVYDFAAMTGGSIEQDLLRRDFTMNALAVPAIDTRHLIDPSGGANDIARRVVRMVSERNLIEDPLRIVKAVRMAAKYGFEIEPQTLAAMTRNAHLISRVAVERVTYELRAILSEPDAPRGARLLAGSGIDRVIFGRSLTEQDAARIRSAGLHDADVAIALLLTEDQVRPFSARWRLSSSSRDSVIGMHRFARRVSEDPASIPITLFDAGRDLAERSAAFLRGMGDVESADLVSTTITRDGERIFSSEPFLTGDEIAELTGVAPGPELGRMKRAMLEAQLRGELTGREDAETFVRRAHSR